jgi:Arc/MetJ-type ribon-helix-helix transcriptional regulator
MLIEERVRRGKYRSPEDVVAAALAQLDQQEKSGDFGASELDQLLLQDEQGGVDLDGEQVLNELRELRERGPNKV